MRWIADFENSFIAFLRRELAPSTERWHATVRVTAATALSIFITQAFHIPQGYWSVITIMVICSPNVNSTVMKMFERLLGTLLGVGCAFIITSVFYQQFWFFVAAFFVLILLSGLVIARSRQPYVGWVFALSILVVTLESKAGFDQIQVVCYARFWAVAIGVFCSWFGLLLIYPVHPTRDFRALYNIAIDLELQRLQWICDRLERMDEPTTEPVMKSIDPAREQKILMLLGNAAFSDQVVRQNLGLLTDRVGMVAFIRSIATNMIELLKNVDQRERNIPLLAPTVALMQALQNILRGLQEWSQHADELVLALQKVSVDFQPLQEAIDQFAVVHEAEITRLGIREGVGLSPVVDQSFMATISMCRAFETIYSTTNSIDDVPIERIDLLHTLTMPMMSPGLRTDASRSFWFAVKLACACLIGLIFINATQYNSFGTMIMTPLMVVGATGGSSEGTRARAKLRLMGTIIGAAVSIFAIIFLIPTADSIPALLLIWIGCVTPLVWILTGGPKISYLGVQAIFCLTIAIGSTFHPSIDLTPVSSRLVGIFLGTLVTLGIFNLFAPDFARNELLGMFSLMLQRLGTLATTGFPNNPGTIGDITTLRLHIMSLVLRAGGLGQNLQSESRSSEPTMTNAQVTEIAQHMTLMLYTMNALALNRVTAHLMRTNMLDDLAEMHACAEAIKHACEVGANGVSTQNYREFESAAKALDTQSKNLIELIPQIRLRPNIRVMDAKSVEFILGQVGMYRVAALRMRDFASLLMRLESERNAQLYGSAMTT